MYEIRTLTIHYGKSLSDDMEDAKDEIETFLSRFSEEVDNYKSQFGISPTYLRIAFPNPPFLDDLESFVKLLEDLTERYSINLGQLDSNYNSLSEAILLIASNKMFASILMKGNDWDEAIKISKALHELTSNSPELGANIGVNTLNEKHFITPYYPLASAIPGKIMISAALTYPNYLKDSYTKNGYDGMISSIINAGKIAEDMAMHVANALNIEYAGVDLSVSPWMEESSLGLVEQVSGVRLPKPGFAYGLKRVNDALLISSKSLKTTGFNEVMLPIAEDSKLKARASEGEFNARDLVKLSGVCLAGLDLAVVPHNIVDVAGLLLDESAYAKMKSKALGVRIIPVEGVEPGDKVDLGRFGETPVISI
ncbi:hypothetical protein Calag_1001 [Caldisphaera lagunensis DSM 15908]|uniref:DUF711 family protein n=1 Tax=Caldisphaera lagunensis (strain DSM 15908 / JCM 11604 / ANMR 0165 / IC-154) TaxID=1056495 RepID=L0ABC7_CALLD|nr:hypothetical protein Calag_1001 [Caldisphaera lagunensis DSM 15908]